MLVLICIVMKFLNGWSKGDFMKGKLKNNKGLTMIELLVSVAILSFVIVGFLNLFVYGTSYVVQAGNKSNTSAEAQSNANSYLSDFSGSNITTAETTFTIHLVSGSHIDVDVTEITATITDGNQLSEIITAKP